VGDATSKPKRELEKKNLRPLYMHKPTPKKASMCIEASAWRYGKGGKRFDRAHGVKREVSNHLIGISITIAISVPHGR